MPLMDKLKKNSCLVCKKKLSSKKEFEKFLPFCSKKCKLIDLGQWFLEDYKIKDHTKTDVE